jgi:IS5 family transposase
MAADQNVGFEPYRRPTRRDELLATTTAIVPWSALCEVIQPHSPKGVSGRPPIGLERMLHIHFIQHWFKPADEACREALYDSASLRRFVGIDLGREPVPDATMMLKFRRLLYEYKLGEQLFPKVGEVALPRACEERHAGVHGACAGQHLPGRGTLMGQVRL